MLKEKEWAESFGKKLAVFSRIYAFLVATWGRMGIGPEIIDWITSNEGVKAFRKAVESFGADFLAATTPVVESKPVTFSDFPIWKTMRRNLERKTGDDYRKELQSKGDQICSIADKIINRIPEPQSEEGVYDLYRISPRMVGFERDVTREEFYTVVLKAGFELAPLWIGPELREEYRDQPKNEYLAIGIDPGEINGDLRVFDVDRVGDGLWLGTRTGNLDGRWNAGREWVFVRRKFVL